MTLPRVRFTVRRLMVVVAIVALLISIPTVVPRHHLKRAEWHKAEASRVYEEMLVSPAYLESQRLTKMWRNRDTVPLTEPAHKFEMSYSMKLADEYNRLYGDRVKRHHALAREHERAVTRPWMPTWIE
ncbi:hypothetical protein TA3x_004315 [Tundrisphaera sp. TA3]|uniref:hypothetical protein n=1 Tax=Tundrisphaera sp. TA3 TaxID=3435775 RepID=UPI003EB9C2C5